MGTAGTAMAGSSSSVFRAQLRPKDGKMSQNGGHHAIRRRKLPLENVLRTFLVTLHFWAVTSVTRWLHVGYIGELLNN